VALQHKKKVTTWRSKQQDAFGMPGKAAGKEELGVLQGQLNNLPQSLLGFGQGPHIRKACPRILWADELLQITVSQQHSTALIA